MVIVVVVVDRELLIELAAWLFTSFLLFHLFLLLLMLSSFIPFLLSSYAVDVFGQLASLSPC